jgi:hypothetical protein
MVVLGLLVLGLGEGSLLTLVFNVLISASPKALAGDVGAMRGVANNMSTALGTAFASVISVGLLSVLVTSSLANNPTIPPSLLDQVNLDNINFISNDQLLAVMSETTATPEQVNEAVRINTETRLRALKAGFLILAVIALLAVFPAMRLPNYVPNEIPNPDEPPRGVDKGR